MAEHKHVCPWWLGYFLINPLRRRLQDPTKLLAPYIAEGKTTMDVGSAMGFFSLPMANMVGNTGKVVCIDLQEKMIKTLLKRAAKAGLSDRIEARLCSEDSLGIDDMEGKIDFALAFAMVHEVPDKERLLSEIYRSLKAGGHFLLAEPSGHVSDKSFKDTVAIAQRQGFDVVQYPEIKRSRSVLLIKKQ